MKIILISSSGESETEPATVTELFENGLEIYHLRKPRFSTREMIKYIEAIPRAFHNRIVIHSHHRLARRFNLAGVHMTKTHKKRKFRTWFTLRLLHMKMRSVTISTSFRSIANLYEDDEKHNYNYVFLSPVFDSLTHKFQSGFNPNSLKIALEKTHHNVIARGGIDIHCLEKVKELGFTGIALYSTIWKSKDPVKQFTSIRERCRELGIVA